MRGAGLPLAAGFTFWAPRRCRGQLDIRRASGAPSLRAGNRSRHAAHRRMLQSAREFAWRPAREAVALSQRSRRTGPVLLVRTNSWVEATNRVASRQICAAKGSPGAANGLGWNRTGAGLDGIDASRYP